MILDLNNMPYGAGQIVKSMLASPHCTPDHILLLADALEEMANNLPPTSQYTPALRRNVTALRDIAPDYLTAIVTASPHENTIPPAGVEQC